MPGRIKSGSLGNLMILFKTFMNLMGMTQQQICVILGRNCWVGDLCFVQLLIRRAGKDQMCLKY